MDMSLISQEIGKKIRLYRKRSHWTIEELAVHIYKSKATVSKYERGEIAIDIETLYDIAEALRVSIDDLLYRDAQKAPTAFWKTCRPSSNMCPASFIITMTGAATTSPSVSSTSYPAGPTAASPSPCI